MEVWTICIPYFCYTLYLPELSIETKNSGLDDMLNAIDESVYFEQYDQYEEDPPTLFYFQLKLKVLILIK